jgi:hypothetical protein
VGLGASSEVCEALPFSFVFWDFAGDFGFIWMILRVLVGGGGKSKSSSGRLIDAPDRPVLPVRPGSSGEVGDGGTYEGSDREDLRLAVLNAAGGNAKESPSGLSLMVKPPDIAGVGSRDIVKRKL